MSSQKKFHFLCYTVEGLNSFATVIYFNYLYFFFRDKFHFDNKHNLALAALIGLIYTLASWQAGKFAQRFGNFTALKIGFGVMAAGLAAGSQLHFVAGAIAAACVVNVGMCFTWPVLEALVSEGADAARAVGIYNITWAVNNAVAFFIGGTLIEKLGYQTIFYVPLVFIIAQLGIVFWAQKIHAQIPRKKIKNDFSAPDSNRPPPQTAKLFQHLAWLSNPFAYIAINTLIAVLPDIAAKFQLSPMLTGFTLSLWCFARVGAFVVLWRWTKWHYQFRWLAGAFALLIISFAMILIIPNFKMLLLAQIFFGVAIGLIYYSSLFYAMDASDTKSEHGGIHEAAIGAGNCLGPAFGATALWLAPQSPHAGVWAVSGLLMVGFGGLFWLRKK